MSKTKTLFTMALLVLLGLMGAAQAQDMLYEVKVFTTPNPPPGREAKVRCPVSILLNFTPGSAKPLLTVTLDYSVPLAGDIDSGMVGYVDT